MKLNDFLKEYCFRFKGDFNQNLERSEFITEVIKISDKSVDEKWRAVFELEESRIAIKDYNMYSPYNRSAEQLVNSIHRMGIAAMAIHYKISDLDPQNYVDDLSPLECDQIKKI